MGDHMYQRGYVNSVTDDEKIAGTQAMCGCVEEMAPIARADCTEAIGRANYTVFQDGPGGPLTIQQVPGSFYIEFQACEGYDYVKDFGPEEYALAGPNSAELKDSNNDLAAFMYRLYLEGKIDEDDGDDEREAACKAAFEAKYPELEWAEREIPSDE